jgi:hypothetical protein
MSTYTCPDGHSSSESDYCSVCGLPIPAGGAGAAGQPLPPPLPAPSGAAPASAPSAGPGSSLDLDAPAAPAPGGRSCPNCGSPAAPGALFCEDCGYDFTTGQMPKAVPTTPELAPLRAAGDPAGTPSAPVEWVAELWVDPDWHAAQDAADPCPSPGMPVVVPLSGTSLLIGRTSSSRNIHPEIDVSTDTGVSRRHAQITTDGQRWWVEDLQSANGTYVSPTGNPLPTKPIAPGERRELADDDRVYIGAWTRLVLRRATAAEQTGSTS